MSLIFVPSRLRERLLNYPEVNFISDVETMGTFRTIPVKGYVAQIDDAASLQELFDFRNCHDSFVTENEHPAVVVTPLSPEERRAISKTVDVKVYKSFPADHPFLVDVCDQMRWYLEAIAITEGCAVTLHLTCAETFEPYDEEGHLHIVLCSRPPGQITEQSIDRVDTVRFTYNDTGLPCPGPTRNRGEVIKHGDDVYIGQIVGSTIYVFLPINKEVITTLVQEIDNPLRYALAHIWRTHIEKKLPVAEIEVTGYESECLDAPSIRGLMALHMMEEVADLQRHAEALRRQLAVAHVEIQTKLAIAEGLKQEGLFEDQRAAWEELQTHPHLLKVTVTPEKLLHYHTKPIYIEDDDGNLRDIGSFVIFISDFNVHIWSTRITHPDRVAHPHIHSDQNAICFGNVSSEIAKLCAVNKKVEAALLCLRWLTEGYEPSLTYHKVEEWPVLEETKEDSNAELCSSRETV